MLKNEGISDEDQEAAFVSRFKISPVADSAGMKSLLPKFDVENYGELHSSTPSPSHYATYVDDRSDCIQLTKEVLPRMEHYKEGSVSHAQRPTLEELHEGIENSKLHPDTEEISREPLQGKVIKFGWVDGVFMRCLLNIWGVMLFIRLSWVIGQAGIGEGVLILCLANLVTLFTTISMCAVSTNGQIKGGGVYYMISRSLGPRFGGAIGLMLTIANTVGVAMYIVGFCESLQDLLKTFDITLIDGGINDIRVVGVITLILILILVFVGMDWVTRTQMALLFVLILSQVDFYIGALIGPQVDEEISRGFVGYNSKTFENNLPPDYSYSEGAEHHFFSVFAVFFPAVTGFAAGANLSGDLKNPSHAIPKGTLLALLVTFLSYLSAIFIMGGCALRDATGNGTDLVYLTYQERILAVANCTGQECAYGLRNDNQMMALISLWAPLIYGGCFAAALSSAIASLVGAPRILQALAKDNLYPLIGFFGEGYGANNDPVKGYILVFCISLGCVLIAQLNAIAPLLSNFFLAAYVLINFSVFHASISKSPGWRPAFKYYNAWVSLVATLLCIGCMFLISWVNALITFVIVLTLYLYVAYRKPDVNWGSSTQAQVYSLALKSVLELNHLEEHVKNYRPQILVLSGMPHHRTPLIHFANLITKGLSLLICSNIAKENFSQRDFDRMTREIHKWLHEQKIKGFFTATFDKNFESGVRSIMENVGVGKLRPNMVLMGYKRDWASCPLVEMLNYFHIIHEALYRHLAIGILRMPLGLDFNGRIHEADLLSHDDKSKEKEKQKTKKISRIETTVLDLNNVESAEELKKKEAAAMRNRSAFKGNIVRRVEKPLLDLQGEPVSKEIAEGFTSFHKRQHYGNIDVWWLYDDGGLTLLIPYILSTRSMFMDCRLRIFSLCANKQELDQEQRNLAALLSKFRISYSDVIVIPDIMRKAQTSTRIEFDSIIQDFRIRDDQLTEETRGILITDSEFNALKERNNRHMRLRELLREHSSNAALIVMTLPMPRKGTVSAALYMAWMELLTKGMPPFLIVRGNQNSVLTIYS